MPAETVACAAAPSSVDPGAIRAKTLTDDPDAHPAGLGEPRPGPSGSQPSLELRDSGPRKPRGMMPTIVSVRR